VQAPHTGVQVRHTSGKPLKKLKQLNGYMGFRNTVVISGVEN